MAGNGFQSGKPMPNGLWDGSNPTQNTFSTIMKWGGDNVITMTLDCPNKTFTIKNVTQNLTSVFKDVVLDNPIYFGFFVWSG